MKNYYFTSDTHFGQERALTLSKRPFKSVEEMDETIIKNINDKVAGVEDAVLFHLGDFGDYERVRDINCEVILLVGNYEENEYKTNNDFEVWAENLLGKYSWDGKSGFSKILLPGRTLDIEYTDGKNTICKNVTLVHKPTDFLRVQENEFQKCLFGHIHGRQMVKKFGLDVGVDGHNFAPISAEDVGFYFNAIDKFYDDDVFC